MGGARASRALTAQELLFRSFEYQESPGHSPLWPFLHRPPRRCDVKPITIELEVACLLGANPFGTPRNIYGRNPFIPFDAIRAGVGGQTVQKVGAVFDRLCGLATLSHQDKHYPTLSGEDRVSRWGAPVRRFLLPSGLKFDVVGNQFPGADHFLSVVGEARLGRDKPDNNGDEAIEPGHDVTPSISRQAMSKLRFALACVEWPRQEKRGPGAALDLVSHRGRDLGPVLNGLFGRKAGTVARYSYTNSNKSSGITWDETTFSEYIKDPKAKVPGTKMAFAGVKDEQKIKDLIAYLHTFDKAPVGLAQ